MRIYGIDFTSAPRSAKPIACAACELERGLLTLDCFVDLANFDVFENLLGSAGPWVAGMDFPFGQPRRLVTALGWPLNWTLYVRSLASMPMQAFVQLIQNYCDGQPPGDKHHRRVTDEVTDARSPMMVHGVPVGKMFLQGAPRLEGSSVSVLPCRPNAEERVVLEAYPALVARRWAGRRSYKSDAGRQQDHGREAARRDIVAGLRSPSMQEHYGIDLLVHESVAQDLVQSPRADNLDALLCAIQAAWACSRSEQNYGIPADADPVEGWIVDPATLQAVEQKP